MIILKINQPGLVIRLSQLKKDIRTPAELNVTHLKVDKIVRELMSYSINDFELKTVSDLEYEDNKQKISKEKPKKKDSSKQTSEPSYVQELAQLERTINKLEDAADRINERIQDLKGSGIELKTDHKQESKKSYVEDDEEFIPQVNLDGMKKKGDTDKQEIDSDVNTEDSEELSKKLSGEDNKE